MNPWFVIVRQGSDGDNNNPNNLLRLEWNNTTTQEKEGNWIKISSLENFFLTIYYIFALVSSFSFTSSFSACCQFNGFKDFLLHINLTQIWVPSSFFIILFILLLFIYISLFWKVRRNYIRKHTKSNNIKFYVFSKFFS